jgi:hypothetical protein
MALERLDVVDAMGIEKETDVAVLSLIDAWDWDDEQAHLLALQEKLNVYFGFIEDGQVWEAYPAAKGKQLRIDVIFRCPPTPRAIEMLGAADRVASQLEVSVAFETVTEAELD